MKKKNLFCYLVIFLFSFSYFYFFGSDSYLVGDDTIFHTSNIMVMSKVVSFFNLVPSKIMPTLVNNLGYGINLFYPMFPHLVGAHLLNIFSLFDMGIADVMKFMHFMVIFLSGAFMYKYIITAFKNRKQALITAILYQSAPYLFTDIFMRGAFNESFIFIYLPIIFLGFYYLFESKEIKKFYICFVIGYSLLIFTHLVLSIYLTLILIPFLVLYYRKLINTDTFKNLVIGSILILLITSNFWLPLMQHHLLDNYYIFKLRYVGNLSVEVPNMVYYLFPIRFADVRPNYFLLFYISPVCILLMVCTGLMIFKKKILKKDTKILKGMLLVLIVSIIFASISFVWLFMPNLFKNIQFAWRLSLFITFGAVVIAGYGIRLFSEKVQKIMVFVVILLGASFNCYLSSELAYLDVDDIIFLRDSCCNLQWSYEYIPLDSKFNSLHLYNKGEELGTEAINKIEIISNDVPSMKFKVYDIADSLTIEFPRIYYLGYELKNEDGEKIELYQNSFGLLSADIKKGGTYYLEYEGTLLDKITRVLSIGTVVFSVGYFIFYKKKKVGD